MTTPPKASSSIPKPSPRKRHRTAWSALSKSTNRIIPSTDTTMTRTPKSYDVRISNMASKTTEVEKGIKPGNPPTPATSVARSLLPAINSVSNADPATPLVLRPADLRSAQLDLGLTPDTPNSSAPLCFLNPNDEAEARALLSSTRRMRVSTSAGSGNIIPDGLRRLSTGSAVTPIPLQLESPERGLHTELEQNEIKRPLFQGVQDNTEMQRKKSRTDLQRQQTLAHSTALPSPITPAHALVPGNSVHKLDQSGDLAVQGSSVDNHVQKTNVRASVVEGSKQSSNDTPLTSLFQTGTGKPISVPPKDSADILAKLSTGVGTPASGSSLFKTGSGKPLPIPANNGFGAKSATGGSSSLFSTGSGKKISIPHNNQRATDIGKSLVTDSSMFQTGSGKKIGIPTNPKPNQLLQGLQTPMQSNQQNDLTTPKLDRTSIHASDASHVNAKTPFQNNTSLKAPTSSIFFNEQKNPLPPANVGNVNEKTPKGVVFTTGKGTPLPYGIPKQSNGVDAINETSNVPMFTTGKGTPLALTKSIQPNAPSTYDKTPTGPMFTTGKGTPLAPMNTNQGGAFTTPSPVAALFMSGKRTPIIPPSSSIGYESLLLPSATRTPGSENQRPPKRTLRRETPPSIAFHKTDATPVSARTRSGQGGRGGRGNARLKTTPFKRPRQVKRPRKSSTEAQQGKDVRRVPLISVPALLRSGTISCCGEASHDCDRKSKISQSVTPRGFLKEIGCLQACVKFQFSKNLFGNVECLPSEVVQGMNLKEATAFDVETCVKWISSLFPVVLGKKPATAVGSHAWIRMSYSLAIRKLGLLEHDHCLEGKSQRPFLSAANVIRELLRRIQREWHDQKQPHLLRIMRTDSSPASHVVLSVIDIEKNSADSFFLLVTDGWYVARAVLDDGLTTQLWHGRIKVGTKIRICGATLESLPQSKPFAFGDGDELGTSVLKLHINAVVRVPPSQISTHLGIHKRNSITSRSLHRIHDNGGIHPGAEVILLRSYPVFYVELKCSSENEDETEFIYRRQEAEDEAREAHNESMRRRLFDSSEKKRKGRKRIESDDENIEVADRDVRAIQEIMVCGITDDPNDVHNRRMIRIYKPSDELSTLFRKEGIKLRMMQLNPKKNGWSCPPELITSNEQMKNNPVNPFPRQQWYISELKRGVRQGDDFSGVYALIYVSQLEEHSKSRFAYFADNFRNVGVLALELSGEDAIRLPQALRTKPKKSSHYALVGLRDIDFSAYNEEHDLIHAKATMRTSFYSENFFKRRDKKENCLKSQFFETQKNLAGGEVQLEILKDAIVQFASGKRRSIGAYFTSTQDIEQTSA